MAGLLDAHSSEIKEEISSFVQNSDRMVFARVPDGRRCTVLRAHTASRRQHDRHAALAPQGGKLPARSRRAADDWGRRSRRRRFPGACRRRRLPTSRPRGDSETIGRNDHHLPARFHGGDLHRQGDGGQDRPTAGSQPGAHRPGARQHDWLGGPQLPRLGQLFPQRSQSPGGAKSGLSSVITSLTVVVVLLFFTPLLYHLPQAVLASVIMMAVIGLVNVSGFVHAWKAQRYDGVISVIAFVRDAGFCAPSRQGHHDRSRTFVRVSSSTRACGPLSLSLSRHNDDSLRAALIHDLKECKYMDVIRFDGPLFFANASYLEDQINERLLAKRHLRHIVIVSNAISDIDASGEEMLSLLVDRVRTAGVEISFSGVNDSVMGVLERTHLIERIGRGSHLCNNGAGHSGCARPCARQCRRRTVPVDDDLPDGTASGAGRGGLMSIISLFSGSFCQAEEITQRLLRTHGLHTRFRRRDRSQGERSSRVCRMKSSNDRSRQRHLSSTVSRVNANDPSPSSASPSPSDWLTTRSCSMGFAAN